MEEAIEQAATPDGDAHGKRERAKAANRQAILDAGRRVFAELGYETATVRDIIRQTDLAAGTFYNYFRSKDEVFDALADDGARRFQPILRGVRESAANFEDYIVRALEAYYSFLVAEGARHTRRPASDRSPHVRVDTPEAIAVYEEVRAGVHDAIRRGIAPPVDPDYLTFAAIGVAEEIGQVMLRRDPQDIAGAVRFASAMILGGLAAAPRVEPQ